MRRSLSDISHTRLRIAMAALLFAIFVLPAAIAGSGFYWYAKRTVIHEVEQEILLIAALKAIQIEDWLEERRFDLRVIGRVSTVNAAVSDVLQGRPGMADSLAAILRRARRFYGERYQSIDVFDPTGASLTGDSVRLGAAVLTESMVGSTAVQYTPTASGGDSVRLSVYAPVQNSDNSIQAVLRGIVPLSPLFDMMRRTLMNARQVHLYDREGRSLATSTAPDDRQSVLPMTDILGRLPVDSLVWGGVTGVDEEKGAISAVREIRELGWIVLVERDSEDALAGLIRLRRVLWSVMTIVLLLGGGVAVSVANLTVRRLLRREEELQATHEQLVTADRLASVGMMAASLAHEINNPLTTIKVLIHSLQERSAPSKILRSDFGIVLSEIDKIKSLVLRFLQFARPRDPEFTSVNLEETLTRIASLIRHQAQSQGILIFEDYDHTIGTVWADSAQIGQVFLNILLNALDATPVGGEIHIETALARDDRAVVTIMNSGAGLPDEIRERIFEPFFSTKATGTGLGLSIARAIVERHRGQIFAQGHGENGTTFTIVLRRTEGD